MGSSSDRLFFRANKCPSSNGIANILGHHFHGAWSNLSRSKSMYQTQANHHPGKIPYFYSHTSKKVLPPTHLSFDASHSELIKIYPISPGFFLRTHHMKSRRMNVKSICKPSLISVAMVIHHDIWFCFDRKKTKKKRMLPMDSPRPDGLEKKNGKMDHILDKKNPHFSWGKNGFLNTIDISIYEPHILWILNI